MWVVSCVQWILINALISMGILWGNDEDRAKNAERAAEARQKLLDSQLKQDSDQDFEIRAIQDHLKVLESAVVEILKANPNQPDSKVVSPQSVRMSRQTMRNP